MSADTTTESGTGGLLRGRVIPDRKDPRWAFAAVLTLYCVLGFLFFGFNRTPAQMFFIMGSGALLDVALTWWTRRQKVLPLSAWISCASLAILLNYAKHSVILFLPVLLAIGGKHVLTFRGRHVLNPSMFGVAVSLLVGQELITAAPAYQWAGSSLTVSFFVLTLGMMLFVFRVGRGWMVGSFLLFYVLNTALRAYVMRHHLPPEMLFIGTLTTPPFFLFTMYMITDPGTSPAEPKMQVFIAFCIALVDLVLHFKESVYTFFYAALIVGTGRFLFLHARALWKEGPGLWWRAEMTGPHARGVAAVAAVALVYGGVALSAQDTRGKDPGFRVEPVAAKAAGLGSRMGTLFSEVDPRLQHVGKWLLSVGDAVAAGDVDGDGDVDLFLSHTLKAAEDRGALYLNRLSEGRPFEFTRLAVPALAERVASPAKHGLPTGGTFADYDGDGDLDLAVAFGYGSTRLLQNRLAEEGALGFRDVTAEAGLEAHAVSLGNTFLDHDNDGDLDLLVLNATAPLLKDYQPPRPLNIFALPPPEHPGDRRMFHFMHDGWHDADNGGGQVLYENRGDGTFLPRRGEEVGLTSTRWSLAVTTADFNLDGYVDLYVANDFGPDELLLNESGKRFRAVKGRSFNEVGNDTYKGMNASHADFDRNGFPDVTVSNVHHKLQAEGSMLWMVRPDPADPTTPLFADEATQRGALNEHRFGWGAHTGDLDNDGWQDLVQANGMVDDRLDPLIPDGQRKDYWYVNHKLMQSGPEVHTYADMWGDLRGRTIYPNEARRAYLNLGREAPGHFVDVASRLGLDTPENSRGVLLSDLDNDGDLDVVVTNQHGEVSLYRSLLVQARPGSSHWVDVELKGNGKNTRGVGAVVKATWTDERGERVTVRQEQHLSGGFGSQRDPRLHFGLGAATGPVEVEVEWPGGARSRAQLSVDGRHVLAQPSAPVGLVQ
jgi:hypothetical protein